MTVIFLSLIMTNEDRSGHVLGVIAHANIGLLIYIYDDAIYEFLNHLLSNAYLLVP